MMKCANLLIPLSSLILLCACATTDYGIRSAGERPDDLSSSEASFWYQMDKAEERLKLSGSVVKDDNLKNMISSITCDIIGEYCDDIRVYLVRDPNFNASMAPNGMMVLNTGLLLRASDESEIAAVIAHEFVHYEENHTLERFGAMQNANRGAAIMGVLGGPGLIGMLMIADGASGFMQEQESEADLKGVDYMGTAGYNTNSAVKIWSNFSEELAVSSEKSKKKRAKRADFLSTHPGIADRIDSINQYAAAFPSVETNPTSYRHIIRPFMKNWLDDEIAKNDPGSTLYLLTRLETLGQDLGLINYMRGRVFVLRAEADDDDKAISAWKTAALYEDVPAEVYRDLGEMYRKTDQNTKAIEQYQKYLSIAPMARDIELITYKIAKLQGANS